MNLQWALRLLRPRRVLYDLMRAPATARPGSPASSRSFAAKEGLTQRANSLIPAVRPLSVNRHCKDSAYPGCTARTRPCGSGVSIAIEDGDVSTQVAAALVATVVPLAIDPSAALIAPRRNLL